MKSRKQLRLVVTLAAGALLLSSCDDASLAVSPEVAPPAVLAKGTTQEIPGQHVFVLNGNRRSDAITEAVAAAGGNIVYAMDEIGVVLTQGLSATAAEEIASGKGQVATDVAAQWVPEVSNVEVQALPADAVRTPGTTSIGEPENAFFYNARLQWNMEVTDTDDAWLQQYNGIPSVRIAILDTGLDPNHQDQFGLIDVASSRAFVPSITGPPAWQDDHYHGTHVGGIVTSNNFGTAGVAPDVTLVAVKVLGVSGSGPIGAIIAGIYYAADVRVDVINMSLGAYFPKSGNTSVLLSAFNRAVNYAHAREVFVVAAAGNDTTDLQHDRNWIQVPCETGVLSCISATGPLDLPANYTNYGTNAINNAAPGGEYTQREPYPTGMVLSLCNSRSAYQALAGCRSGGAGNPTFGINYLWAQGTSMAAPHVAGLGAYLDSQHGGTLNGSQILTQIQQHADDLGKPGAEAYYGKGRVNTCRTLPGCVPLAAP